MDNRLTDGKFYRRTEVEEHEIAELDNAILRHNYLSTQYLVIKFGDSKLVKRKSTA